MDINECKKGMIVRSYHNSESTAVYRIMNIYKNTKKIDVITNRKDYQRYNAFNCELFYKVDEPDETGILS